MNEKYGEKTPHWSYFGNNGWLRTDWQYLDEREGEKTPHWSYFGNNGWLRTGWYTDGRWHLFDSRGWMYDKPVNINGMQHYFNSRGYLDKLETQTPLYNQYHYDLASGCGGVSLYMAMQYKGYLKNTSLLQFFSTMPYTNTGNPNLGFVGNPRSNLASFNKAIFPKALAKWGSNFGNVSDFSGASATQLVDELRHNNISVVLMTWNYIDYPITQYPWGAFRDLNHHFNVLVGYDFTNDHYKVMNCGTATIEWVNGTKFRQIYNGLKGAVLVK